MTSLILADEKVLLQKLRAGDEQAFEVLYTRYSGRIYGNILKLVKDKTTAQELLQDVFMKLWEKRETIEIETSFSGYLFSVSKHLVYNFMRRLSVTQRALAYLTIAHSELYRHIEEDMQYKETQDVFQQALGALPTQRQKIYRLCKIEGKSYEEVARLLGISVSTVNDHIVKATRFIREQFVLSGHLTVTFIAFFLLSPNS